MTHRMILATADLSKVYKVVVARRKDATVADRVMHVPRKDDDAGSIPVGSSSLIDER